MKKRLITYLYLIIHLFVAGDISLFANDDTECRIVHRIGVNVRPSYILPTHGFYNGWNPLGKALKVGGSIHADYSFEYSPTSTIGQMYPGSYQGVGIGIQSFCAHQMLGTPFCLYLFQGSPVAQLGKYLTLDYEWNFGISGGWKPHSSAMLLSSEYNAYINVGVFLKCRLNKNWDLQAGPEYTHFSNGDTKFPNGGANTVNFRIGARRVFNRSSNIYDRPSIFVIDKNNGYFLYHLTYDLTLWGAWRADRLFVENSLHVINKPFSVGGCNINPLYHFNHCLSAGVSLDFIFDRSANLSASVDENDALKYSYPDFLRQCAAGISIRGELKMPIFSVNIGVGYNLCAQDSDLYGIYTSYTLKAFITDSLYLNVGYRLGTVAYAHNMMFGLGWRIKNTR